MSTTYILHIRAVRVNTIRAILTSDLHFQRFIQSDYRAVCRAEEASRRQHQHDVMMLWLVFRCPLKDSCGRRIFQRLLDLECMVGSWGNARIKGSRIKGVSATHIKFPG